MLARLLEPTAAQHYAVITCRVALIACLPGCFRFWLDGTLSADWQTSCNRGVFRLLRTVSAIKPWEAAPPDAGIALELLVGGRLCDEGRSLNAARYMTNVISL